MLEMNYLAIIVAAVVAFIAGAVWYSPLLFGNTYLRLRGLGAEAMAEMTMPIGTIVVELVRTLVVSFVFAYLITQVGVGGWLEAILVGVGMWLGFPAMILLGSIIHENVPGKLAVIHAGDWLVKLLLLAVILSLWR